MSPLSEIEFRKILDDNPGYTTSQRIMDRKWARWIFSTDPFFTVIQDGIITPINVVSGSADGWDFDSLKKRKPRTQEEKNDEG